MYGQHQHIKVKVLQSIYVHFSTRFDTQYLVIVLKKKLPNLKEKKGRQTVRKMSAKLEPDHVNLETDDVKLEPDDVDIEPYHVKLEPLNYTCECLHHEENKPKSV